jgi:hypothetical protein
MGFFSQKTSQEKALQDLFSRDLARVNRALASDLVDVNARLKRNYKIESCRKTVWTLSDVTALFNAVIEGDLAVAQALLAAGADPNMADETTGVTPLMLACVKLDARMVEVLLKHHANVTPQDNRGCTALHFMALGYGDKDSAGRIAVLMVEAGADPNVRNHALETPVILTSDRSFMHSVYLYLKNKLPDMPLPAALALPPVQDNQEKWVRTGKDEITLISEKPLAGYRLTEIFNFARRSYFEITSSLEVRAESTVRLSFSDFTDTEILEEARQKLIDMGGTPKPVNGRTSGLDKPKMDEGG